MLLSKCPICNNKGNLYKKLEQLNLYFCKFCQHRYTDESSIKNKEVYSSNYFAKKHGNYFANPNYVFFEEIYKIIKSSGLECPNIIDVGCSNGDLLYFLAKKNKKLKLTGIDFQKNKSNEKITFISGDLFNIKFDQKFDFVINIGVIEHIRDVQKYTKYLSNLLNNSGIIITMTLDDSSLLYKISRTIYPLGFREPMERIYDAHHLNHFSKKSLKHLFKINSLDIKKTIFYYLTMKTIDYPYKNIITKLIYKIILMFIFKLEKLFDKSWIQVVCAVKNHEENSTNNF